MATRLSIALQCLSNASQPPPNCPRAEHQLLLRALVPETLIQKAKDNNDFVYGAPNAAIETGASDRDGRSLGACRGLMDHLWGPAHSFGYPWTVKSHTHTRRQHRVTCPLALRHRRRHDKSCGCWRGLLTASQGAGAPSPTTKLRRLAAFTRIRTSGTSTADKTLHRLAGLADVKSRERAAPRWTLMQPMHPCVPPNLSHTLRFHGR